MTTDMQCRSDPNGDRCKEPAEPGTGLCCGCEERARKAGIEPERLRIPERPHRNRSFQADREAGD